LPFLRGSIDTGKLELCSWAQVGLGLDSGVLGVFLTLGITLRGSWSGLIMKFGLGRWWFWEPLLRMPSFILACGTALLHSLAVTEKRVFKKAGLVLWLFSPFLFVGAF